jgi:hypothetical protein
MLFLVFSLWSSSPTIAQGVPHLEECTLTQSWDFQDGQFGVKNICNKPVTIQFMAESQQQTKSVELKPGERFNTGLGEAQIKSNWWVFTTCPVGYVSSIPFEVKYKDALADGHYNCVEK